MCVENAYLMPGLGRRCLVIRIHVISMLQIFVIAAGLQALVFQKLRSSSLRYHLIIYPGVDAEAPNDVSALAEKL